MKKLLSTLVAGIIAVSFAAVVNATEPAATTDAYATAPAADAAPMAKKAKKAHKAKKAKKAKKAAAPAAEPTAEPAK